MITELSLQRFSDEWRDMMRKKNKVFLIIAVILVGLLITACERSATTGNNGGAQDGNDDQLTSILTVVASQQPVGDVTPEGVGGGADDEGFVAGEASPTPEGLSVEPPTATPLPPTATPIPTAAELTVPNTYTLKKGEFPFCLARRFNVDVNSLLSANNLARGATYPEGLTLTIPKNGPAFQGERMLLTHPVTYTVLSGDTFYNIACRYGNVYPEQIASVNNMSVNDTLQAGTQLSIP
jgi:LysM repeat protein